jgi:hypothetical protein
MRRFLVELLIIVTILFTLSGTGHTGETGHYANGLEGIKAATVPGPGLYYIMYNLFYTADELNDKTGNKLNVNFDVSVFANAHRFIWVSPVKILGADYLFDATLPFIYTDIEVTAAGISDKAFALGDICVEPFALSWHGERYDTCFGLAAYLPVGKYDQDKAASPGKDFWTGMLTLGGTYYFDTQKTWSASILSRYEIHSKKSESHVKPGNDFHFEWGIGKTLAKNWDVGLAGYCQWQVTDDRGSDVSWDKSVHDRVWAIGPEVRTFLPGLGLGISLRGLREFDAVDRSEGYVIGLNLTKIF